MSLSIRCATRSAPPSATPSATPSAPRGAFTQRTGSTRRGLMAVAATLVVSGWLAVCPSAWAAAQVGQPPQGAAPQLLESGPRVGHARSSSTSPPMAAARR